nr:Rne/Rng family ribonuclease [Myxococcota bacterium]
EIVVQIAKEPIGTKGARITSHVSIAGRHLVLTPWAQRVGVSRKIDSDKERRRLRDIVKRVKPADLGFIIRTAGEAVREADLEADVRYLTTVWDDIQIKKDQVRAPEFLYSEPALDLRVVRDFAGSETKRIVVDDPGAHQKMKEFLDQFVADPKPALELYDGASPIFDEFGIEAQIDTNLGRKVWLKSGGYLIIDQSEALTAIDVNTGRYVGKRDLEETVLRTNLEAVREIVNQLRFRNIGGLIILDLIDMDSAENRDKVYRALQDLIRGDKAKTNILKISELGLVEMTRKRTRESLVQMLCEPCAYCEGKGYVLSDETVAHKVLREIKKDLPRFCGRKVAVTVARRVAHRLLGPAAKQLEALEEELGREIEVRARAELHLEQFEIQALDEGPPMELDLPWMREPEAEEPKARSKGKGRGAKAADAEEAEAAPEEAPAEPEETALMAAPAAELVVAEPDAEAAPEAAEETGEPEEAAAAEAAPKEAPAEPEEAAPAAAKAGNGAGPTDEEPEDAAAAAEEPEDESDSPGERETRLAPAPPSALEGPIDANAESPILPRSLEREDT